MRTNPTNPFELYEPRPNYRHAVRVTTENIVDIANYIGANRCDPQPIALVDHYHRNIVLQTFDGSQVLDRAYLGDYIVEIRSEGCWDPVGWSVVKRDVFQPNWRKCVGDEN